MIPLLLIVMTAAIWILAIGLIVLFFKGCG